MQRFALDPLPQPSRWPRHSLQLCAEAGSEDCCSESKFPAQMSREQQRDIGIQILIVFSESVASFRLTSVSPRGESREDNCVEWEQVEC